MYRVAGIEEDDMIIFPGDATFGYVDLLHFAASASPQAGRRFRAVSRLTGGRGRNEGKRASSVVVWRRASNKAGRLIKQGV